MPSPGAVVVPPRPASSTQPAIQGHSRRRPLTHHFLRTTTTAMLLLLVVHRAAAAGPVAASSCCCSSSWRRLAFAASASLHARSSSSGSHSRRPPPTGPYRLRPISSSSTARRTGLFSSGGGGSDDDDGGQSKQKKARAPKKATGKGKGKGDGAGGEETFRLDRLLANRGVGTRTEVTALIRRGRVKRADTGEVVKDPTVHLPASLLLLVQDQPVAPLPLLVAYHKPLNVHSTMGDPRGRPNLEDALPPRLQKTFHPVGRLDADTTGLLLFSGDGQLTQRLLHPSSNVQRQYVATVEGEVDEAALRAKLAAGVETADGTYEADLLGFTPPATVCVGVAEGKHRMVRRMLANAGHGVLTLHRVRYGEVELGDLEEGEAREIPPDSPEGRWALALLAGGRPKAAGAAPPKGGGGGGGEEGGGRTQ